ncbi:TetR/AcrR family transcriptional regulator [Nocardia huaxiensis]|uniref:TetR/AcrR family transcriptional regulator n=1 Tax=Nocardia huaxiensis TaxID=2755382 RepID=A0A7D6VF76_9NOCA|nr:TetR/AcrR family transcriptional regulator [Nocardia huaxiensis]QLY33633.1 TetR/AcrR family transcriptional regulator [Nocardia huaxiensis]UFS99451.1 TetR/AcrR family transcriptional regulator [Nocardia huaxiensis]
MSEARERLLDTATRLFYAEGIHTVGIDRIIAEAAIAKATFYRHFKTKDDLVVAYLTREYARQKGVLEAVPGEGAESITAIFERLGELSCGPGFRGCPFLNAAVEFPNPDHAVRAIVDDYRGWFRDLMAERLRQDGHPDPDGTARALLLTRDGVALSGGVGDSETVRAGIRTALAHLAK